MTKEDLDNFEVAFDAAKTNAELTGKTSTWLVSEDPNVYVTVEVKT